MPLYVTYPQAGLAWLVPEKLTVGQSNNWKSVKNNQKFMPVQFIKHR